MPAGNVVTLSCAYWSPGKSSAIHGARRESRLNSIIHCLPGGY